jgi:cyclophilin family peptidyl-prolyl cis-trans isomerase
MASLALVIAALAAGQLTPPPRPYHGVGRPVMVDVAAPPGADAALALLDADGKLLAPVRPASLGPCDLGALFPEIWTLRKAAWVQCLAGDSPAGAALVVEPLLSRLAPRTEPAQRPDGTPYARIVGWGPDGAKGTVPRRVMTGLRIYGERDAILHTSLGDIVVALRPDEAPATAWNFLQLVDGGFYEGVVFHRVVPADRQGRPFVIQGGDPTGTGDGEPGYWLPIEPSALPHDFGVISMARDDDPDSAGCQFFFCLSREGTSRLDGQYCAFGYAVDGAAAIRAIAAVELADVSSGRPVNPPVIRSAELVPSPPRAPGRGRPDLPLAKQEAPPESTRTGQAPR